MNLFFLSDDPYEAAAPQADVHVVKMILETLQMLSTAIHYSRSVPVTPFPLYKVTHANHPTAKWVRYSTSYYAWALKHAQALCTKYTRRYNKTHKYQQFYDLL